MGCREAAETGKPALEDGAHDPAGHHHVGVGQSVADLPAVALGVDEAGGAEDREVLRDVRLTGADLIREPADLPRPVSQAVEDLEPAWAGDDLEDVGLEEGDLVHATSIATCASAHECRGSR